MSPHLRSDTYTLTPGDRLIAYTDGLLEVRNAAGEFLPLNRQISCLIVTDPDAAAVQLVDAAVRHAGEALTDDVAVLVLDVDGGVDGGGPSDPKARARES